MFSRKKESLYSVIKKDLKHFSSPVPLVLKSKLSFKDFFIAFFSPEFRLVLSYRIQRHLYQSGLKRIAIILYLRSKRKYSSDIHPMANIGEALRVGHHVNIVIGPDVSIGSFAYIFNGVSIGNKYVEKENSMPTIGNFVILGTGSKILGDINIEDNCVVGANAVLLHDLSKNTIFTGRQELKKLHTIR